MFFISKLQHFLTVLKYCIWYHFKGCLDYRTENLTKLSAFIMKILRIMSRQVSPSEGGGGGESSSGEIIEPFAVMLNNGGPSKL